MAYLSCFTKEFVKTSFVLSKNVKNVEVPNSASEQSKGGKSTNNLERLPSLLLSEKTQRLKLL